MIWGKYILNWVKSIISAIHSSPFSPSPPKKSKCKYRSFLQGISSLLSSQTMYSSRSWYYFVSNENDNCLSFDLLYQKSLTFCKPKAHFIRCMECNSKLGHLQSWEEEKKCYCIAKAGENIMQETLAFYHMKTYMQVINLLLPKYLSDPQ